MIPGFLLPVFRKRKNCQLSADKSVIIDLQSDPLDGQILWIGASI